MTILYTTLQKLAFNHAVNLRSAGADVGLLRCLQADCRAVAAAPEMRDAAAELLLQLSTPNAASATPTYVRFRLGPRHCRRHCSVCSLLFARCTGSMRSSRCRSFVQHTSHHIVMQALMKCCVYRSVLLSTAGLHVDPPIAIVAH